MIVRIPLEEKRESMFYTIFYVFFFFSLVTLLRTRVLSVALTLDEQTNKEK